MASVLVNIAPSTEGIIDKPASLGEKPSPTCRNSGVRKGVAPLPSRANTLPSSPMRKVGTAKSAGENSGSSARVACSQ